MEEVDRRAQARAEASEWWLQVQPGNMSREERQRFVTWLRESPIHVEEMLRVAQVYRELVRFDDWQSVNTEGSVEEKVVEFPAGLQERATPFKALTPQQARKTKIVALAASLVAIALTATWLYLRFAGQTIATDRAERRELALSDGSVLQLDPQTRMRVRYDGHSRHIELKQGRALFRVAKDRNRPFTVQAYDTLIRAVGTAFAVERKAQGVTVTVAEGKVAVSSPATSRKPSAEEEVLEAPILVANEQLTVKRFGTAGPVRKVDPQRELAWTAGRLVFENTTVADAVAQFNRYNGFQLRVEDAALAARRVSGLFDSSDPESFVSFLQTVVEIRIDRSHGQDIALASRN